MKLHSRWRVKLYTYVSYFFLPVYFFKLFQLYLNNFVPLKLHSCKVQMSGIVCNTNVYDTFLEQPSSGTPNVKICTETKLFILGRCTSSSFLVTRQTSFCYQVSPCNQEWEINKGSS
jgi:hypothetical protein